MLEDVNLWGPEMCGTEEWCAKVGGTEGFCGATVCTVDLGIVLLGGLSELGTLLLGDRSELGTLLLGDPSELGTILLGDPSEVVWVPYYWETLVN